MREGRATIATKNERADPSAPKLADPRWPPAFESGRFLAHRCAGCSRAGYLGSFFVAGRLGAGDRRVLPPLLGAQRARSRPAAIRLRRLLHARPASSVCDCGDDVPRDCSGGGHSFPKRGCRSRLGSGRLSAGEARRRTSGSSIRGRVDVSFPMAGGVRALWEDVRAVSGLYRFLCAGGSEVLRALRAARLLVDDHNQYRGESHARRRSAPRRVHRARRVPGSQAVIVRRDRRRARGFCRGRRSADHRFPSPRCAVSICRGATQGRRG